MPALKIRIHHLIVKLICNLYNVHGIFRLFQALHHVHPSPLSCRRRLRSIKDFFEQSDFQSSRRIFLKMVKILLQHIFAGFSPYGRHAFPFLDNLPGNCKFNTKLCKVHQRRFHSMKIDLLHQVQRIGFPLKKFGKSSLLDAVIQSDIFRAGKSLKIRFKFQTVISADCPHEIFYSVFQFQLKFVHSSLYPSNTSPAVQDSGILVITTS